ncbi:hypothetical protein N431DRAFT_221325 [Stipitochalara longipes BDJ]|nr:hypothetical protein N431DRAFT_221325 [Stipitochalara longipes BDJ]
MKSRGDLACILLVQVTGYGQFMHWISLIPSSVGAGDSAGREKEAGFNNEFIQTPCRASDGTAGIGQRTPCVLVLTCIYLQRESGSCPAVSFLAFEERRCRRVSCGLTSGQQKGFATRFGPQGGMDGGVDVSGRRAG